MSKKVAYQIHPIGYVRQGNGDVTIELMKSFAPGLKHLDLYSHVMVFWWANKHDTEKSRTIMQTELPYALGTTAGVFACRAEYRPNPIAMTVCKVLAVDEQQGTVTLAKIDAFDGSPVLDLKGYIPVCDRVQHVQVPKWYDGWPEWMPDEGLGLD
ncbi:MAG: TrmO family methyltransferase domain-containing protein [Candidatus Hermodarchaeia archaeon]|jgi:tRNA-Thr(GGU) m(6)t(6)A37 methyltransferase TsaA